MYQDKLKGIGEHHSVAEELLSGIPELAFKLEAVDDVVREGYASLEDALENYGINELQYLTYLLVRQLKNNKEADTESQFSDAIEMIKTAFAPIQHSTKVSLRKAYTGLSNISMALSINKPIKKGAFKNSSSKKIKIITEK